MSTDHGSPPPLPEPETPAWLTLVGAILFLTVGAWWMASQPFGARPTTTATDAPRGAAEH